MGKGLLMLEGVLAPTHDDFDNVMNHWLISKWIPKSDHPLGFSKWFTTVPIASLQRYLHQAMPGYYYSFYGSRRGSLIVQNHDLSAGKQLFFLGYQPTACQLKSPLAPCCTSGQPRFAASDICPHRIVASI